MPFEVYSGDFINGIKKEDYVSTHNSFDVAKETAYALAEGFCEDELPRFRRINKKLWIFDTNCDFGSIIKEVEN